jgi:hypothetical protein
MKPTTVPVIAGVFQARMNKKTHPTQTCEWVSLENKWVKQCSLREKTYNVCPSIILLCPGYDARL